MPENQGNDVICYHIYIEKERMELKICLLIKIIICTSWASFSKDGVLQKNKK